MRYIRRHSDGYNFIADSTTGITMRWGKTLAENPNKAPIPELVDISISNHCSKGCSYCYRDSNINNSFISIADYEFTLKSLNDEKWGNVFQVALGGGEPFEHPKLIELLKITRTYNIVPNITTNGDHITQEIASQLKPLIGAIAVSFDDIRNINQSKASILIAVGIKTNIHFILDRTNINQAIEILKGNYNEQLSGFSSIIFLTFKPMGRGTEDLCLVLNDDLKYFCALIDKHKCNLNIGFDSCFMPMLMHFTNTTLDFIEPCECAFFSAYIDEHLNVKPCSFSNNSNDTYNLKEKPFSEIWNIYWESFRNSQINSCLRSCNNKNDCRGGCPYYNQLKYPPSKKVDLKSPYKGPKSNVCCSSNRSCFS